MDTMSEPIVARPVRRHAWQTDAFDGQVLVIFALFSMVLIGALALSIDAGFLMSERRQVQSSADAGAMAAARAVLDGKTTAIVTATGQGYGTYNASVPAGNVTVTQSAAPAGSAYAGTNYVTVTITKNVTRIFIGAIYTGTWSVDCPGQDHEC